MSVMKAMFEQTLKVPSKSVPCSMSRYLTTDAWTSISNDGYLAVTRHGLDQALKLCRFTAAVKHLTE